MFNFLGSVPFQASSKIVPKSLISGCLGLAPVHWSSYESLAICLTVALNSLSVALAESLIAVANPTDLVRATTLSISLFTRISSDVPLIPTALAISAYPFLAHGVLFCANNPCLPFSFTSELYLITYGKKIALACPCGTWCAPPSLCDSE